MTEATDPMSAENRKLLERIMGKVHPMHDRKPIALVDVNALLDAAREEGRQAEKQRVYDMEGF